MSSTDHHIVTADASAPHRTIVRAFGTTVTLAHADDSPEVKRQTDWLKTDYEFFLASRVIPKTGLCVDVGAGDGWFAIAFAAAFPAWQVLCFEADPEAAERLRANAAANGLNNVVCVVAGFHPDMPEALVDAPERGAITDWAAGLAHHMRDLPFQTLSALGGRLDPLPTDADHANPVMAPCLPVSVLAALAPDLLKMDVAGSSAMIAEGLRDCPVGFIMGQLYDYVPSALFNPTADAGPREYYLRCGTHTLRRDYEDNFPSRQSRLDVVVAMYNAKDYIVECVDSLLADGNPDIHVIVVDDGSTDRCGDLVAAQYASQPRVRLVRKPNGGCASARNFGRAQSNALHIAFVDADDRVDPGMFTALLETARYTGAFVVEGEFKFFHIDEDGTEQLDPSYEAEMYPEPGDKGLGDYDYTWIRGEAIATGQPTIWRRVHRRDFLDRKNIYFPEHVRAFDDQIFQLMIAHYCGALAHVHGHFYHYRQHPDQDIKQGDERHFYSFNMFRTILLRSLDESWSNIEMVVQSLLNTMQWSYDGLRSDLKPIYVDAAVEFVAVFQKTYGYTISSDRLRDVGIDGFDFLVERRAYDMRHDPVSYGAMQQEDWRWQPEMIRMMQRMQAP
ncbi:MAG: FkbM family methyltransferase [Pseudomonadota bacterium]